MTEWHYKGAPFDENLAVGYHGFVYLITDLTTSERYIGKKNFHFRRKTRKSTRRVKSDSDWKTYYGSSDTLNARIAISGSANFKREILVLCKTAGELNFSEVMALFHVRALEDDRYINESINKWRSKNVKNYTCLNDLRALLIA
ncbi:hypothetical protein [Aureimonas altamirensis]|uniref:hypothetical protein n=1 Tax=Aureimonas altamirensis TaxID=370622 RepID=UPI003017CF27